MKIYLVIVRLPSGSSSGSSSSGNSSGTIKPDNSGESNDRFELTPETGDSTLIPGKNSFGDIDTHWAKDSILKMAGKGMIKGYEDGSFKPNATITRAEFATLLARAFELTHQSGSTMQFKDVAAGKWYTESIQALYDNGITSGRSDGTFGVSTAITNEEICALLYRAMKATHLESAVDQTADSSFKDSMMISPYAKEAVAYLNKMGIVNGRPDGTFAPKSHTTRAQVAVMLDRLLTSIK